MKSTHTLRRLHALTFAVGALAMASAAHGKLTLTPRTDVWNGGFCTHLNIANPGSSPSGAWTVTFDLPSAQLNNSWNGVFKQQGSRYTVTGVSWNSPARANQSFDVGFCGKGAAPSPGSINLAEGGAPPNPPPPNPPPPNPPPPNPPPPTSPPPTGGSDLNIPSTGSFAAPFSVNGNKVVDATGAEVSMRGINWFGFETQDSIAHGLWARGYKEMIAQMKQLGFNAVRLPFCPKTLRATSISGGVQYPLNPDLQGKTPLQAMDRLIAEMANSGMYVLLDHHRPDCNAISTTPQIPGYSLNDWVNDLVFVTQRYKNVANVIGIDLKNEPHEVGGNGARWGTGNIDNDWKLAAERAGSAVLAANPKVLVFIEGISGNNGLCESADNHWWGGNIEPMDCFPIDPSTVPRNKLVLSPHIYGPSVASQPYFAESAGFPNNMPAIWQQQVGRFMNNFAIVPGEFGGKFEGADQVWQTRFVDWLKCKGAKNFFFWSWNPNSGDTGGIVGDDWKTVNTAKYNNLKRLWDGSPTNNGICTR